jgi:hypothetical protein
MIVTPVQNALMNDRNRSGADGCGTAQSLMLARYS